MSEQAENTTETKDEGVQHMSLEDAMTFAQTGETPVPQAVETSETQESKEESRAKEVVTPTEVKTDDVVEPKVETTTESVKTESAPVQDKPDPKQEVKDPYADILDDEDRAYLNFKKNNPGTTRADYEDSKVDYESLDRKQLLRKSLREKYGLTDSDAALDEFIEEKLGIPMDTDEKDMSLTERVALRQETEGYINDKKAQQAKWAENATKTETTAPKEQQEMVQLEDGTTMPKADYDKAVQGRKTFLKNNEDTLNRVKETSFKMTVDDNGEKRELSYGYEFDKDDRHRVLSIINDAQLHFKNTYETDKGYNHEALLENKAWEDPTTRNKMLTSFAEKIRAEAIEESLKDQGNVTLGTKKPLPPNDTPGVKMMSLKEVLQNN